jgi:hypothetical protein
MKRRDDGEDAEIIGFADKAKRVSGEKGHLLGLVLEEGDQVVAVLWLLEATEGHLGAGDVLLGVLEVGEQGLVVPCDTLLLVRVRVGETLDLAGLAAEETVQVGADLVALTFLQGVALCASCLLDVRDSSGVGSAFPEACGAQLGAAWIRTLKRLAPFLASPEVAVSKIHECDRMLIHGRTGATAKISLWPEVIGEPL